MLMGVLAVAAGKVAPAQLAEWSQVDEDLGEKLVASGILTAEERDTFDGMIAGALQTLDQGGAKTIQSFNPETGAAATVLSPGTPSDTAATVVTDEAFRTGAGGWRTESTEAVVPAVGEHPGRYEELRVFGSGGMGQILLVHDGHLGRDVALKTLLPDKFGIHTRAGAPTAQLLTVPIIARFLQEARITGQLEHPSIVPVYELGYRADGSLYYTMKLVRGRTLSDALEEAKTLADRLALLNAFLDICFAIAYAHSRGVIHRDIKPLNIMIGEFGETVMLDWGIAKLRGQEDIHEKGLREGVRTLRLGDAEATVKTMYGQTIGSPFYMPPEQADGRTDEIDERSDVYSLGSVLYHILVGTPPYWGNNARQFLEKVSQFPPKPIRELCPEAPPELVAVCERAMARDPAARYQNAKDLAEEIQRFIAGGLVGAYQYSFGDLLKRFVKKHAKMIATIAAAVVALIAVGVYSYIRVTQERDFALEQERIAQEQRAIAVEQEKIAVTERDRAENELYFANVALAQRAIEEQRMGQARELLAAAPGAYRAWEWGHLQALANADAMTLKAGGRHAHFLPGGTHLLTGSAAGGVAVHDLRSGEVTRTLAERAGFSYALAAGGGLAAIYAEDGLSVVDPMSGEARFRHVDEAAHTGQRHVALSADGAYVAALNADRAARVWRVADGAELLKVPVRQAQGFSLTFAPAAPVLLLTQSEFGDEGWVRTFTAHRLPDGGVLGRGELRDPLSAHAAAFSPDATRLALGTDRGLQLWDTTAWQLLEEYPAAFQHPGTIAFSPDGARLAAGTLDGHVLLIDVASRKAERVDSAHQDTVRAVAFTPDGGLLITGSFDRTAKLWSAPGLLLQDTLRGHDRSLMALACNAEAPLLATAGFDGVTKLWRLDQDFAHARPGLVALNLAQGRAAGALGNEAALWDTRSGARLHTLRGHGNRILALAMAPTGARVATAAHEDGTDTVRLWDAATGAQTGTVALGTNTTALAFLDGDRVLLSRAGTTLRLHEADTGASLHTLEGVEAFGVAENGAYYAAVTADPERAGAKRVAVYRPGETAPAAGFPVETVNSVALYFSPDAARLYAGVEVRDAEGKSAGRVHVWDLAAGAAGPVLDGHKAQVTAFAESADGAWLATGDRLNGITVWNRATGAAERSLEGHASAINALAFSPDGTRLASASLDLTFRLWETATGRDVLTLQNAAAQARGQVVAPGRVAFSPDALRLVTLTEPEALPPVLLPAFPWDAAALGGSDGELEAGLERYKREAAGLAALLPSP
jgi:WD40 repeat protein